MINKKPIKDEKELNNIKTEFEKSYFYFDPMKLINRNSIENCSDTNKRCGRLQLRIDIDEIDIDKKIKIHGIFPDEGLKQSGKIKDEILFTDEMQFLDEIYNNNFITFFDSDEKAYNSFQKHLKFSNQTELNFKNNTIWLAEAIMILFKNSNILDGHIISVENKIKKKFDDHSNFIWGFDGCSWNTGARKLYVYFKVCFNYENNLWQFCSNNYNYTVEKKGFYTDGRKKKTLKKSSRKSVRKVSRKSRKSSRKVSRKSARKSARKSVRKSRK